MPVASRSTPTIVGRYLRKLESSTLMVGSGKCEFGSHSASAVLVTPVATAAPASMLRLVISMEYPPLKRWNGGYITCPCALKADAMLGPGTDPVVRRSATKRQLSE